MNPPRWRATEDTSARSASFAVYVAGRVVSGFGSSITRLIVPLEIYRQTQSESLTSLAATLTLLPILLFGIPSGVFADRCNRVRLMRYCELASSFIITLLTATLFAIGSTPSVLILTVTVIQTIAVLFDSASFGIMPKMVEAKSLGRANSIIYGSNTLIGLVAPVIGGWLYEYSGLTPVFLVNSICFGLSTALMYALRLPLGDTTEIHRDKAHQPKPTFLLQMSEGLHIIWSSPLLRFLVGAGAASAIAGGALTAGAILLIIERLDSTDGRLVGIFSAVMAAGALAATIFLAVADRRINQLWLSIIGFPLCTLTYAAVLIAQSALLLAVTLFAWNAVYSALIVNNITLRQQVLPEHLQGRVNATARTLAWGGTPVGAGVLSALLLALPLTTSLLICLLPLAVYAVSVPFTKIRKHPQVEAHTITPNPATNSQ